jgi:3-oxoacyl-[acyl-carrier-protein] synthase II
VQDKLLQGVSGISRVTRFDASGLSTKIAGEVDLVRAELERYELKTAFALRAAKSAMKQATECGTVPGSSGRGARAMASMGLGLELFSMDDLMLSRQQGFEFSKVLSERLTFMQTPSDLPVHLLSHRYGLGLPPSVHVSACAAGTDAIGSAMRAIAEGRADWALAGGTDSMINPLGFAGFCTLDAMSRRNDEPQRASRPFSRTRDGFVMGEGAGVLILEPLQAALARGATPLALITGYGCSFDAHAITEPHPEGRGALAAMRDALADPGILPSDLSAINAHGTSTIKNDLAESAAIAALMGPAANNVAVVSTKSMIGHLISAAGAVEAIAAILCMRAGWLHPTINLEDPDPGCPLDYVANSARAVAQRHVLSCSYGFGGMNSAIVISKYE